MRSRPALENADAVAIVAAAKREAIAHGLGVGIVVLDDGGHLLAAERLDGAPPVATRNAYEKARTAIMFRRPTKLFEGMAKEQPSLLSLDLQIIEGGTPIFVEGECVGAIGVSGATREQDGQVAQAGLATLASS